MKSASKQTPFKSVWIALRTGTPIDPLVLQALELCKNFGLSIQSDPQLAQELRAHSFQVDGIVQAGDVPVADLGLIFGGDGTLIGAARRLSGLGIPIVGIHMGRLGFLTDIPKARISHGLCKVLSGQYVCDPHIMIDAAVLRQGVELCRFAALNEVSINRSLTGSLMKYQLDVDNRPVCVARADGVVFATPTGSTAYALAAGGPIISPAVQAFCVAPICPQNLSNRPLIISDGAQSRITLIQSGECLAHWDGQLVFSLQEGDEILLHKSKNDAVFLHPPGHDFYRTLREKLGWNATTV